jgi:Amidohydrolase family
MQLREQLAALAASGIAVCPTLGGHTVESLAPASQRIQQALGAGVTLEVFIEMRMSILRGMTAFGVRLISGTDAGIARIKAHGNYADAVIELGQVTGTVPALAASSSSAAAAIGLGRSKGRLRRGYDADIFVVEGDLAADPAACTAGRAPGCAGLTTAGAVLKRLTDRSPGAQVAGPHKTQSRPRTKDRGRIDDVVIGGIIVPAAGDRLIKALGNK